MEEYPNDFAQEQGIMDIDPSHDHLNGLLTPASQGLDKPDDLRMNVDGEDNRKVKFAVGTPSHEGDPDVPRQEHEKSISADDFENMKPSVLEPLGDLEVLDEKYDTWEIRNYQKLLQKNYSPEFECGGYKWRILFFPWGNNQKDYSSAYIEAIPPENAGPDWYICAQFAVVMWNPTNPTKHRFLHASHRFYTGETDWGFTQFVSIRNTYSRSSHSNDNCIAKGGNETNITAYVRVVKDATGVLWHNFRDYDSRRQTGYVGLRNQGATCYMNSLLQSLYFTNTFRKIVFKIPTEGADPVKSLALALQRVFVQLQTSPDPVSTTGLTQSFGWDSLDSFVQHDAQEFERVLLEGLENCMKEAEKTNVIASVPTSPTNSMQIDGKLDEGSLQAQLKRLFCGKMESYIRCVNVDYESRRGEEFWDLQLNVKGFKDLRASFENQIAVEMMEGDNQYRAEGHGLQDAEKGVAFLTFPPVLHLQLKRFEYDINRDAIVKINDRYEFPLEIDLSDFLAASADRSVSYNYKLHGVLVHSGDVHGGHYFGMIKPEKDSKWYRYDDERVIPVTIDDVLEENFGGDAGANSTSLSHNGLLHPQTRMARTAAQWKRFTSAYMLVYFRESALDEILASIGPNDIPRHVVQKVEEERLEAAKRKREKEEMHLYITVRIIDVETFRHHDGVDLASFDPADKEAQDWIHSYRVRRDLTWLGFYQYIAETVNRTRDQIRLWHLVNRQNKTVRPDVPVPPDPQMTIEQWLKSSSSRGPDIRLYMERAEDIWHPTVSVLPKRTLPIPISPPAATPEEQKDFASRTSSGNSSGSLSNGDIELEKSKNQDVIEWPDVGKLPGVYNARHDAAMILIFLKWFDVDNQVLRGIRPIYVNRHDKTGKLTPIIANLMSWHTEPGEPPANIAFYEEIKPGMIEPLKPNATFMASEIQDGDIICFMRGQTSKRLDELLREGKYTDPIKYYEFLYNKIIMKFVPRYIDQTVKEEFSCVLSKTMKYEQVAAKVAEHLKVQPTHLRFTPSTGDGRPRTMPVKRTGPISIIQQFTYSGGVPIQPTVFYEVLELSLVDMESKREITINWLPDGVSSMEQVTLLVPRQATFEEVVQALVKKQANIPVELYERIRLFDVRGHKEYREFQSTQALSTASIDTSYGGNFYAEPIPQEEEEASELDRFIIVVHFSKELTRLHGVPVKFVVKPRELWYDTKKRLQKRLGYKDKEFQKIKIVFIPETYYHPTKTVPIGDEDILYDRLSDKIGKEFIGLDHPDRSPNRKLGFGEKALSIKS